MKTLEHKILQSRRFLIMLLIIVITGLCVMGCDPKENSGDRDSTLTGTEIGSSEETVSQGVSFVWSADSDCSICHTTEHASFEEPEAVASQHATLTCLDCHTEADIIGAQHENVNADTKMTTRLKKTSIDDDLCLTCHNSYSELATRTTDSAIFVDNYGTVVNPHDLPASSDHDSFSCARCHDIHIPMEPEDYQDNCLGCHHTNVYECGTCH